MPRCAGSGIDQSVHERAIDPSIDAGKLLGRPCNAIDDLVDHAAIDTAGQMRDTEDRLHK